MIHVSFILGLNVLLVSKFYTFEIIGMSVMVPEVLKMNSIDHYIQIRYCYFV